MHPHDKNCMYCGAEIWASYQGMNTLIHIVCPNKPPMTAEEGAAVAFGLMGMAEAIRLAHPPIIQDADWHLEEHERAF
jgi:hypothetical protein